MLLFFVFFVMGITFYQERKTERALEALRDLSSPRALVIRDGRERRIAGREVVRGDILVIKEGDRVPADALILSSINLMVDESLLTGEFAPVRKTAGGSAVCAARPGGDDLPFIYSSTLVVQGHGIARVISTGIHTEIGKIGKVLQTVQPEDTLLQIQTGRLVRQLAVAGLSLCGIVVVVYGLTRGNWLDGFLAGITLAMAVLPEEFPVVLTIFLALGAWRISQKQVLTRRVAAIETLGSATVLCVDKTGTLTLNQMSVKKIFADGEFLEIDGQPDMLPEAFHGLIEYGILASQHDPFDPMEKAILQLGNRYLAQTEHLHRDWELAHEYPLSKKLLALSHVWKSPDGADYVIASKGAPEAIADLCHFDKGQFDELSKKISSMADDGLRVLGVARARFHMKALPNEQHDFDLEFVGLVGLSDPVRPGVADAIQNCYAAGIRVIMITGDYPGTAHNIARQIGLASAGGVITGPEMDGMGNPELLERIKTINIFARVVPEQKLRLVNALKATGEIVAMTGDGVNDAPALKSAHIGIGMGGRGTDVARESSALVLLNDDFSSIVEAVRLGRRIFDNIRKAMSYILAIHVPIAGMTLIPLLFKWPLVFLPVHIVFLELIIDPACSIVFEAEHEEADVMDRPPRNPKEPLFGKRSVMFGLLQGVSVLIIVLAVFSVAKYLERGEPEARALAFTTLIFANLGLIFTNRSWSRTIFATLRTPNKALWWVSGSALVFLGLVLYIPFLRGLFHFAVLHPDDLAICFGAGIVSIAWFELMKVINGRRPAG
jgi:Ca2+-transporting ATPase